MIRGAENFVTRPWRRRLRGWGTILFLCLLGAVAAIGARVLIESAGDGKHTRYEPIDVQPHSISTHQEREREESEQRDRVVLEKEK